MALIISRGRKTSKTTQLIELCAQAEKNGDISYIVCHSQLEATRIFHKAKEMGLTIGFPITYDEFLNSKYHGTFIKKLFFDNADMFLQSLTSVKIEAITINTEERVLVGDRLDIQE